MSSAPPPGHEGERGSTETTADRPALPDDARPPGAPLPPGETERLIAGAVATGAEAEVALYEEQVAADAGRDPKRAAALLYAVAHLYELRLGRVRDAGRSYTQSLTSDPTLQANTWALFRLFASRGAWDNLVRLLDAEIRFAPLANASDRADVLLEKGRVLEDHLGRADEARATYRAALELDPTHPAALLALLFAAVRAEASVDVEQALSGLATSLGQPELRALFAIELARVQRGPLTGAREDGIRRAVDTLLKALAGEAASQPICTELDRISLLADDADLRERVLDVLDSRLGRGPGSAGRIDPALDPSVDPAFLVAIHREKARGLRRRGARDAAMAVLERALRVVPKHPLVVADMLDLAEEAGRPDAIAALLDGGHLSLGSAAHHEALLRRGETAARAGALGEAAGSLDQILADSPFAPLATLARARVLARLGDAEALEQLFSEQAERLVDHDPGEAAHLFVRAAIVRHEGRKDARGARPLLERALALSPDDPAAREALRMVLAELGAWGDLTKLYEREAATVADPERRRALQQSLVILHRDLLRDPAAARVFEAELPAPADDLAQATRLADQAGDRLVARGEGAEDAIRQLRSLSERVEAPRVASALRLLAARLAADAGAERGALALTEEAFRCDAGSMAAGELERLYRQSGRDEEGLRVLEAELRAHEESGHDEAARALRFRLALAAADAGRPAEAVAALASLRARRDRAAVLWSLELARAARGTGGAAGRATALEAQLLDDPAVAEVLAARHEAADAQRWNALAEAREDLNDPPGAADAFRRALDVAGHPSARTEAIGAALGLLRTDGAGAAVAVDRLAGTLGEGQERVADELRREAELIRLATGQPLPPDHFESAGHPLDAVRTWLRGLRDGRAKGRIDGLAELARAAGDPTAGGQLWTTVGLRQLASGSAEAWSSLAEAARTAGGLTLPIEVAVTDAAPEGPLPAPLAEAFRLRADRLTVGTGAGAQVAEALLLELGEREERDGHLAEASAAFARALEIEPGSLEAVEGLRRLSQALDDRRGLAAALARSAALLHDQRRAAGRYAEAARLFEQIDLPDDAAAAFVEVLRRVPGDDEAYTRLHALTQARAWPTPRDAAEALVGLISFRLGQVTDPQARVALYAERAALCLGPLDDKRGAIHDHRRLLALAPGRVASLRLLARLASEEQRFAVAADLLAQALPAGERPDQAAVEPHIAVGVETNDELDAVRLELATAYEADERPAAAARVLRAAVEARPEDRHPRERLIAVAMRMQDHALAAEHLQALQALTDTPAERAAVAIRLGRLERDRRRDSVRALAQFRTALQLDSMGDAIGEMVATIDRGPLAPEDAAVINDVIAKLRTILAADPLQVRPLECLRDLAGLRGLDDLRGTAAQLLGALGVGASRGRSRDLSRALSLAALGAIGTVSGDAQAAKVQLTGEIWPHLCDGVARLGSPEPGELGATRQARLPAGTEPRLAWAEAASVSLGIPSLTLYVGGLDDLGVAALDVPEACLVLGRGVLGGEPSSRFRVGRALALLRQKATALDRISTESLALDWAAAGWLAGEVADAHYDQPTLKARAKTLGKALSRREIKSLQTYADSFERDQIDVAAWRSAVLRTANRFGLLVAGDLAMSLRALSGKSAPTIEDLRSADCLDLIGFALSDRHAAARQEAGLVPPRAGGEGSRG